MSYFVLITVYINLKLHNDIKTISYHWFKIRNHVMTLKSLANHWTNPLIIVYFSDNSHIGASAGVALVDTFSSFFTFSFVCLLACSDFRIMFIFKFLKKVGYSFMPKSLANITPFPSSIPLSSEDIYSEVKLMPIFKPGAWRPYTWFLEITFNAQVYVCVYACVRPPRP